MKILHHFSSSNGLVSSTCNESAWEGCAASIGILSNSSIIFSRQGLMIMQKYLSSWHVIFSPKSSCCFPFEILSFPKFDSNSFSEFPTTNIFMCDIFVHRRPFFVVHKSHGFSLKPSLIRVSMSSLCYKIAVSAVPHNALDSIKHIDFWSSSCVTHVLFFSSISCIMSTCLFTNLSIVKSSLSSSKKSLFCWR